MNAEQKLKELGLELPVLGPPKYSYVGYRKCGDVHYISGQVSRHDDGRFITGKVGHTVSIDEAQSAARQCALYLLAVARSITGSLESVEFIKLLGMVNATPTFTDHAIVVEGCSRLLVEVMGERGQHARSAVGVGSLPGDVVVEIEAIVRKLD
ncbi:RidA family protein [Agrobacterium sp. T29]|uniref:RidA family protein n=1 Tax=Agrobacterium sp. T29 TaxID=2580515 RepID=UPI00115CFDCD|nr:RidA family protein [Agrobacterium sp. T29]